jgi:hypothetical protein
MLVDADGRLGLGVAAPAVRVDIKASGAGKALRIEDGTPDKQGKLLVSDAEGTGRWKSVSGGIWWYASLDTSIIPAATADTIIRPYTGYKNALVSTAGAGSVDRTAGTITVPSTGRYRITLCIHFMSNRQGGTPYWSVAALLVNGSGAGNIRWSPSSWGALNGAGMLPTFTTILNLNANDVLLLAMDQREGGETNQAKWRKANYATSPVQLFMVELIQ